MHERIYWRSDLFYLLALESSLLLVCYVMTNAFGSTLFSPFFNLFFIFFNFI